MLILEFPLLQKDVAKHQEQSITKLLVPVGILASTYPIAQIQNDVQKLIHSNVIGLITNGNMAQLIYANMDVLSVIPAWLTMFGHGLLHLVSCKCLSTKTV